MFAALVCLSIAAFCLVCIPFTRAEVSPEVKLKQLSDLAFKSRGNVITLDDSTYPYYAISTPRPYTLIVLLTALNPKYKCTLCKSLDAEYTLLAESYRAEMRAKRQAPSVFFLRLDYEQSPRTFQNYETSSVPLIFHIAEQRSEKAAGGREYEILIRDRMQQSAQPDAEAIAKFVRQMTGASFEIRHSMLVSYVILAAVLAVIILLINPVIKYMPLLLEIIRFKPLWMAVSAAVYTCAISGFIFDIIRSPPMYC